MAPVHHRDSLPPACEHFRAEPVSVTQGKQLADGRWMFSRRYHCPDCDVYFTEQHAQDLPREGLERGPSSRSD